MVYTVYYFIYGVKLPDNFLDLYEKHLGPNSYSELINQCYQGDFYIGKSLWSTENCNWIHNTPCTCVPVAKVSPKSKLKCLNKIRLFKDSLPEHIAKEIAEPDFYWCSGTS